MQNHWIDHKAQYPKRLAETVGRKATGIRRDIVYYPRNVLGEINGPRTLKRDVKSIQYHGFEYYLGYETYETILHSGSTGEDAITRSVKMQTDIAKNKIEKWILEEIENHLKRKACNNDVSGDNTDDNNTGGDSDNGGGADNGNGSNNGDNNTTDPTQDPNKVCVSNFFKYYGDGTIQDDLKKGDKDAELYDDGTKHQVKELQEFLEAFGYNVGSSGADGWFGTDTKNALIDFQSNNGLDADGIVGSNTRDAMNSQNCYDKPPQ